MALRAHAPRPSLCALGEHRADAWAHHCRVPVVALLPVGEKGKEQLRDALRVVRPRLRVPLAQRLDVVVVVAPPLIDGTAEGGLHLLQHRQRAHTARLHYVDARQHICVRAKRALIRRAAVALLGPVLYHNHQLRETRVQEGIVAQQLGVGHRQHVVKADVAVDARLRFDEFDHGDARVGDSLDLTHAFRLQHGAHLLAQLRARANVGPALLQAQVQVEGLRGKPIGRAAKEVQDVFRVAHSEERRQALEEPLALRHVRLRGAQR
mmetsp:Transcript_2310/g.6878  ORF Transcript_2310/g.6878 Transcript_2310/m.6878 type:complete len:265 (+) Transcript_2310:330-1124(+)